MCETAFDRRSKHGNDPIFCTPKCRSRWHYENDRERANEHARKWRAANRDKVRAAKLRTQYGLDQASFDSIFAAQGHGCAICGRAEPRSTNWHVDHDHACCPPKGSCGKCVRGILCGPCNRGLGYFGDDESRLVAAAEYLRMSIVRGV
jgi:hypothetical protein